MSIEKILDKLKDIDPATDKPGVFWEDIDTAFRLAFAEKDKEKRTYIENIIHMLALLSDIELLKNEKAKYGGAAADYTMGMKIDEFYELHGKVFVAEKFASEKKAITFDPSKHKLVQDTLF